MVTNSKETARRLCDLAEAADAAGLRSAATPATVDLTFENWTPLMNAASVPNDRAVDCVQVLLDLGADAEFASPATGETAMHWAAGLGNCGVMRLLPRTASLLNCCTAAGDTPLMLAAGHNRTEAVRLLISWGADVLAKNAAGKTAADFAQEGECWSAYVEIAAAREDMQLPEADKRRLLAWEEEAARLADLAGRGDARQLRQAATRQNCDRRYKSRTPLMRAAELSGNAGVDCARLLLRLGADPRLSDCRGWSAAHYAAWDGNGRVLQLLPSDCVRLTECDGWTPLTIAAYRGNETIVRQLLSMGADAAARSLEGFPVIKYASSGAVRRLLLKAEATAELKKARDIAGPSIASRRSKRAAAAAAMEAVQQLAKRRRRLANSGLS